MSERNRPNILITGTPGTGKSKLANRLQEELNKDEEKEQNVSWKFFNVGKLAREKGFLGNWDPELECHELEEEPLLDFLEAPISQGGVIIEHHVTDFFPERFFDIVFVLRTDSDLLHKRLKARDYNDKKLQSNVECEIFQTVLDEARECYPEEIVHELRSDNHADVQANVDRIKLWVQMWKKDNQKT